MSKAIVIYHSGYGCDSGCCGHRIEIGDAESEHDEYGFDDPDRAKFSFDHPYGSGDDEQKRREWAENLIREEFGDEHVADLDWDHCVISDD